MKISTRRGLWLIILSAMATTVVLGNARTSRAVPVSYTIDPTRSSYHIVNTASDPSPPSPLQASTILSVPVIPQSAGADTVSLSGVVNANEAGGVLTFTGTSSIALGSNPAGPFAPATNPGTDNLGIVTNGATPVGVISVAIRNWVFTIQSGTATNGALPSAGSIVLATTSGYQQNSFSGQTSLVGSSGPDVATTPISLTTSGGIETLVLPVIRLPVAGTPGQIYISGTIVATRAVPEPATVALAATAALGLAITALRRKGAFAGQRQALN